MSKEKFDVQGATKKFISGIGAKEESTQASSGGRSKGRGNRSVDKVSGAVTKQVGYYVTLEQDKDLSIAAIKMDCDKSTLVREALDNYLVKLRAEGVI